MRQTTATLGILLALAGMPGVGQEKSAPATHASDVKPTPEVIVSPELSAERKMLDLERAVNELRSQLAGCSGQLEAFVFKPLNDTYAAKVHAWCEKLTKESATLVCDAQGQVVQKKPEAARAAPDGGSAPGGQPGGPLATPSTNGASKPKL